MHHVLTTVSFEKDGTWSWIVLSMLTFILFLEMGTIEALIVLLPDMKEQLSSTWIVESYCISIIIGWGYFLGKLGVNFFLGEGGWCIGIVLINTTI